MSSLRQIHLYLGCFFAPLLAFFAFTGILQTLTLHEAHKGETYQPPAWIKSLALVHKDQHLAKSDPATAMKALTIAMGAALITTMILGVILAFKLGRSRAAVIACLLLGVALPLAAVLLSHTPAAQ
jgi:hypothetical protein